MTVRYYPGTYVRVALKFLPLFDLYKVVGKNVFVIHRDVQPVNLKSVPRSVLKDFLNKDHREVVDLTALPAQAAPSKVTLVMATEKEKAKYLKLRCEYAKECVKQVNAKLRRGEGNHAARIRRATDSDIKLALSIVEEGDESEGDDDGEGDDQDDNQLKAWTVSFTYYEDYGDNSSDAKFHRQIMYARSEDSIREQIENFMPFNNYLKPTDILIGAPTKL